MKKKKEKIAIKDDFYIATGTAGNPATKRISGCLHYDKRCYTLHNPKNKSGAAEIIGIGKQDLVFLSETFKILGLSLRFCKFCVNKDDKK